MSEAFRIGLTVLSLVLAVVVIAERIADGDQVGCRVLSRPARPETCGQDIDVPVSVLKGTRLLSNDSPVGLVASL